MISGKPLILGIALLTVGCRVYYDQGVNGGNYSHMQTPKVVDNESVSKNYISAKYNKDVNYYAGEDNIAGELSYHKGGTNNRLNYAYGAFIYAGEYKVNNLKGSLAHLNKDYSFYGGGLRGKIAINQVYSNSFSWRIIGMQASWSMERGDFYQFKRSLIDLGSFKDEKLVKDMISGVNDLSNFTFFPYTGIAIGINNNLFVDCSVGFGCKLNRILSLQRFVNLSIAYKQINIWGTYQKVGSSIVRKVNNDLISSRYGDNTNLQLGVGVCF